jgi:hypothetical protein
MTSLASMTTRRAPYCPSCGELAARHSEYVEGSAIWGSHGITLVRLLWTCVCGMDVVMEGRAAKPEGCTSDITSGGVGAA